MFDKIIVNIESSIARLYGQLQVLIDISYSKSYDINDVMFVQKNTLQHLQTQLYITEQILDEVKQLKKWNEKYTDKNKSLE